MKNLIVEIALTVIILTSTISIMPFVIGFIWASPILDGNLVKSLLSLFVVCGALYTWVTAANYTLFGPKR